jgi:hypothetical protein
MVDSGQPVALASGVSLCGMDRAVHAVALAGACDAQGWGFLCMLDDHAYAGRESFEVTAVDSLADGPQVSRGPWTGPRPDEPRHGVSGEPVAGPTVVSWGTPPINAPGETTPWPRVSRARHEMQEHRVKRMMAHGALKPNDGRKTMVGPDRQQQRARDQREQSLAAAHGRLNTKAAAFKVPQAQVGEATATGHGTRLEPRQRALGVVAQDLKDAQHPHAQRTAHAVASGPPRERADRACRQQTIMTVRTLLLANALMAFMGVLYGLMQTKVSLDGIFPLLFERSGSRMATASQVVYGVNTTGVSLPYRRLLREVVDGLCAMELKDQGKPMHVRLKDLPP